MKERLTIINVLQAVLLLAVLASATVIEDDDITTLIPAALSVLAMAASMFFDKE